jgi:sodium transport system permease protein
MSLNSVIIARKEMVDHCRDRRSLTSTVLQALMGPAAGLLVSFSPAMRSASAAATLISMMSLFTLCATFTGGMNVAMDAMAGERERRSLVPLLLNPVMSRDVVIGKWIVVSLFAFGVLAINVAGAALVVLTRVPAPLSLHVSALWIWLLCGLVPLVFLASALELLISARCRTAKEAQTALMGVIFIPMFVGMFLAFFPDRAGQWWLAVPIVGQQTMLGKEMLGQPVSLLQGLLVAAVTTAATVPFLAGAIRRLERDDILAG